MGFLKLCESFSNTLLIMGNPGKAWNHTEGLHAFEIHSKYVHWDICACGMFRGQTYSTVCLSADSDSQLGESASSKQLLFCYKFILAILPCLCYAIMFLTAPFPFPPQEACAFCQAITVNKNLFLTICLVK